MLFFATGPMALPRGLLEDPWQIETGWTILCVCGLSEKASCIQTG